ncbi:hypothetical protein E4Q23_19750 [Candidatus Accumulibacter phosphatis]|uniref:Uncharacterized protein n=1 Tax=Candidatus Accumulibacter phosphatis TaxID=327160 RepID=A0ABX1U385_9PROT|nr:hypothetical protein [Candidatus Accumulibacter phosphatis]NMQ29799.1 hypothetical protein [Candidatus Accumulibacter phosphatis]
MNLILYSKTLQKLVRKNDVQATAEMVKLRDLRERFRKLHEKHVVAVAKDEILLAHDLVREIHTLLAQIEATVRAREGTIARDWFGSLPNAYLRTPEERDDPEYHAVMRDVGRLSEATVDRVQGLRYPGSPPQSVRAELRALAFESGD